MEEEKDPTPEEPREPAGPSWQAPHKGMWNGVLGQVGGTQGWGGGLLQDPGITLLARTLEMMQACS